MNYNFLSKIDKKILWLLKLFLAAPLLLPLFVSSSFLFPYTSIKAFLFRIIIEIAAVLYLYLALRYPVFRPSFFSCHSGLPPASPCEAWRAGEPESRPKKSGCRIKSGMTIGVAVLVFLIINFFSALFGLDFYHSFWGDLERMNGIWSLAHFVVWFLMLGAIFQEKKYRQNLLKFSVGVGSLVALLAIFQKFTSLGLLMPQAGRVFSTIGNPAFLGTYLLFNIFFAGYLAFISKKIWQWMFVISCCLLAIGLLFTGTRGAFLGLAAGVVIFLALIIFAPKQNISFFSQCHSRESGNPGQNLKSRFRLTRPPCFARRSGREAGMTKNRIIPVLILAAIFLLATGFFLARDAAFVKNNYFLSRLTSISLSDASTQSRLILWQDAWRTWQAQPILGWGPENFETAMGPHLSPQLADYEAYGFDRAHNFIFDYGVTIGWLGLLAYLGIFVAAGWVLIKKINFVSFCHSRESGNPDPKESGSRVKPGMTEKKKDEFFFSVIFISLLAAYLIQNFFVFDTFISYLMLFFTLAVITVFSKRESYISVIPAEAGIQTSGSRVKPGMTKIATLFFVIFIIFSLYSFNLKPLRASYLANQILISPPETLNEIVSVNLEKILALKTFASPEIIYQITLDYLDKINQAPQLTQDEDSYKILSTGLADNIRRSPSQPRNYIALAWLNLYFSGRGEERINLAINLGQKALILSPAKKDAYLILVAGYTLSDQKDKALEIVSQMEKINGNMGKEVKEYWEKIK